MKISIKGENLNEMSFFITEPKRRAKLNFLQVGKLHLSWN